MGVRRWIVAGALSALAWSVSVSAQDAASPAMAPAKAAGKSAFVKILTAEDQALYRALFQLASQGDVGGIDQRSAGLKSDLLMGHVMARAYLASGSSPSFDDLSVWMDKFADHPEASRIFALARRKDPNGKLKEPEKRTIRGGAGSSEDAADMASELDTSGGQSAARRVRSLLSEGNPGEAQSFLASQARSLHPGDYNQLVAEVAGGFYYSGRNDQALKLAMKAAQERDHAPLADWIAGLANWRAQNYADAAKHFDYMARQPEMTSWLKTAAAFWAGRSYIAARQPQRAREVLEIAASKPRTFYGLLANRLLGDPPPFSRVGGAGPGRLDKGAFQRLTRTKGIARAVALAQTGQRELAEDTLLRAHGKMDRGLDNAFVALAADMGFTSAQVYASSRAADPRAAYPMLPVQPSGGFQVDSAFIHAIVRQESRFDPAAVSSAGARGLMQVLPSTAKLGEDPNGRLFDPVYNLTVGQNYVREMMRFSSPDGSLLQTAVAYNGGPGNLQKWRANIDYGDDPLLFIESLPNRETRGYVERVMANYWIYQMRMGKPTPTLDQLASGKWPIYGGAAARSAALR
jgi:soluble lytic murein transglycosylase-like protein